MQEEEEKEDDTIDRNGRNRAFRHTLSRHEESSSSVTTGINQDQITTRPKTSTLSLSTSVSLWRRAYNLLTWIPPSCRWDAEHPTQLTLPLNFLFGFAAMFTVSSNPSPSSPAIVAAIISKCYFSSPLVIRLQN